MTNRFERDCSPDLKLNFLASNPFSDLMSDAARDRLIDLMTPCCIEAGTRFIHQGEEGDSLYIIDEGAACVNVEKDGVIHPIAVLGPGDIVGEMALLTGENRNAHVDANSDLIMLKLNRVDFDHICEGFPEVRQFLTQTVTQRFARATYTADRTIGKYVINEIIGRGGWSVVYKGVHKTLNMPVAIKMLKHNMAMDTDFLEEFQNEAKIIASLNHENIIKVYDIENLYRTVFIIMEFLQGSSLETTLKAQGSLSVYASLDILLQICEGLAYAHRQGIIHRDVKPGNIFIQDNGHIKIVDFGLACAPGTRGDRIVGTPKYLAPEQIKSGPADERSDIYSLGLTAYRMLAGNEAFPNLDIATLLHNQLYEEIPDPRDTVPEIPDELCRFISKATQKSPNDRFQSVSEATNELNALSAKLGLEARPAADQKMSFMGLFLFYRQEQQAQLKSLIKEFGEELEKTGVVLKETDFPEI